MVRQGLCVSNLNRTDFVLVKILDGLGKEDVTDGFCSYDDRKTNECDF